MICVIQRVSHASVRVSGHFVSQISQGILALVAIEPEDTDRQIEKLANRLLNYRIFPDAQDRMNLSLKAIQGELLVVPQFTLAADTRNGNRPSFTGSAEPEKATRLFEQLIERISQEYPVQTGQFGADMQVELLNNGPVTFILKA